MKKWIAIMLAGLSAACTTLPHAPATTDTESASQAAPTSDEAKPEKKAPKKVPVSRIYTFPS